MIYGVIVFWMFGKIISRFGGMKIALYRARGVEFFSYVLKSPSHERKTYTRKMSDLEHHSPLGFEDKNGGLRFWPEADKLDDYTDRWFGGPLVEYLEDDARPMPISKHDGLLMTAQVLIKPYKNKSASDLNRIGTKIPKIQTIGTLLIFFLLLAQAAALYYQLYYGQNIACAVHAHGVNC